MIVAAIAAALILTLIILGTMKRPPWKLAEPLTTEVNAKRAVHWIIILAWAASTVPSLIQNLTTARRANAVVDAAASTQFAALAAYGTAALLILFCLFQIVVSKTAGRGRAFIGVLLILLPWAVAMISSLIAGANIPYNSFALPIAAVALWRLNATFADLAPAAWLTGLTAVIALAMGILVPARGLLHGSSGLVSEADKAVIGDTLLSGPFNHPNQLGVVLALGIPAVFLLRHKPARFWIFALTCVALAWSASRGSLAAVSCVMVAAWFVTRFKTPRARKFWAFVSTAVAAAVVAHIPLTTEAFEAFSDRGQIWAASIAAWRESPVWGNGYTWYSDVAKVANDLTSVAFNGHNLYVHALVTGGVALVIVLVLVALKMVAASASAAGQGITFPLAYTISFFLIAVLEVPTRFRDIDPQSWVALLPLVVLAMWNRETPPDAPLTTGDTLTTGSPAPRRRATPPSLKPNSRSSKPLISVSR